MITYQLTLKGFDASRDDTDDLIKWVNAPSRAALDAYVQTMGWTLQGEPETPFDTVLTREDGVDAILS